MCHFVPSLSSAQATVEDLLSIERRIFLEEDEGKKSQLLLEKSELYISQEKYQQALNTLQRISTYQLSDEDQAQLIDKRVLLNFLLGNHNQVKNILLEASLDDAYVASEDTRLVEVLNYVALGDLETAEKQFSELNQKANSLEVFDVKKLKKQQRAYNLSLVIPGSGQIYAGHFFKGLVSLGVQGALFTYGVIGIQEKYFFTQALPSIGIFQGFYFGGAEYARELVEKRNEAIVKELSNNIVNSFK